MRVSLVSDRVLARVVKPLMASPPALAALTICSTTASTTSVWPSTRPVKDFFKWLVVDARLLNGDPTLPIRRPKRRDPERRTFSETECLRIIRACRRGRDVIAAGLVLSYGLRKGELQTLQGAAVV
jgi:integrase